MSISREEQQRIRDREQQVGPDQKLEETWRVQYTKLRFDSPVVARLIDWPWFTKYVAIGTGDSVDRARLELITMLARAIYEDPNPFGDLGNVAHVGQVYKFLNSLLDEGANASYDDDTGELVQRFREPSEYFLPDNLMEGQTLPDGWEEVVMAVITLFQSWAEFYPEDPNMNEKELKSISLEEVGEIADAAPEERPDA
jgi:hypothetical protein